MRLRLSILGLALLLSSSQALANPRKVRAVGTMALYGTIGGGLLGLSSLAFGAEGRTVAKGASLGLYAGLIFGSYIVLSHGRTSPHRDFPREDYGEQPDSSRGGWFEFGGGTSQGELPPSQLRYRPSPAFQIHLPLLHYRF